MLVVIANFRYTGGMKMIDLRSDTVTHPTDEMRAAMASAVVGDDVYGDDPTINELELFAARLVGKEAALFVPSGTFGNQLALFSWCPHGAEVILDDSCHIVQHEAGAAGVIAGVNLRTVSTNGAMMSAAQVEERIRKTNDIHYPKTGLVCMENAHSNGRVFSLAEMEAVYRIAQRYTVPVHLDGARLFNAAAALNVDVKDITQYTDSVMFCLSKGLCAPVGSIIAGPHSFIEAARYKRKIMGGAMRQAGILAAAGLIALKKMTKRLVDDHEQAGHLAEGLQTIPDIEVFMDRRDINFVFFRNKKPARIDPAAFVEFMREKNIIISPPEDGVFRFACHHGIGVQDIDMIINAVKELYG